MLKRFIKKSDLDESIDRVKIEMHSANPGSDDYNRLLDDLERLVKLRAEEKRSKISPDTIAIVAGNLLGILVIVAYEQKHVLNSRGFNFILKPRQTV